MLVLSRRVGERIQLGDQITITLVKINGNAVRLGIDAPPHMVRDPGAPHSATSEFFINLDNNPDFDFRTADEEDVPGYCVFGEVISGMEVVDRIAQLPTARQGDFEKVPSPVVSITSVERLQ